MALKLMYITDRPEIAQIVEAIGVDRVFVDMEHIGKTDRQGGMDTVQSHHTLQDVAAVRKVIHTAQLLVRCNPIHEAAAGQLSSEEEVEGAIAAGADILMLPYFKTAKEVERFVRLVDGRAQILPLVETAEAVACIDEILAVGGFDEVFVGLNDLSISSGKSFLFEPLADGTVDRLCDKFRQKGLSYGFGGIASLGKGLLPSEYVIKEHCRLGSSCAILSRSFCNTNTMTDVEAIRRLFESGVQKIRTYEELCRRTPETWEQNRQDVIRIVNRIVGRE